VPRCSYVTSWWFHAGVGLIGETVQAAADQIATCGATRILAVSGPDFATARHASDTAAAQRS